LTIAERITTLALESLDAHPPRVPESVDGFAGILLVAEALARAGRAVPRALRDLARAALVTAPDRDSLYEGRAGLLAILDAIDRDGTLFARPRAALRAAIGDDLLSTVEIDPHVRDSYDLVSGVAGKVIALRELPDDVAAHVRGLFAEFADRVAAFDSTVAERPLDLGVAHGVPAVLAALNIALPGERALARRYVDLLVARSFDVDGARRWDSHWDRGRVPPPRRAWCYQTVGVAAVLHDRALLDGDDGLRALALDALRGTLREPEQLPWDDALCHGRAGVALIYARLADADPRFGDEAARLARTVLENYRDDVPFGYRAYNLVAKREEDRPSFLDAALGIALFLIEAARPSDRRWLPLFGLRPEAAS